MRIRLADRFFVFLIKLIDMLQHGILKNYALFSLIISHAPQKLGAKACYYRAFKEFLIAYRDVPAYRKFLEREGWSCKSARSRDIFESLPVTDTQPYPQAVKPIIRTFGMNEGPFLENQSRIKKRYVKKA